MTSSNDPGPMPPPQEYPGQQFPGQLPPRSGASFGQCVLASLVWFGVVFVVLFATLGAPASGYALGLVAGRLILPLLLTALITWLIFRRRPTNFGILVLTSLPFFVVLSAVTGVLRLVGRG